MTMEHFRALKRTVDGLVLDAPSSATSPASPAVPLAEGTVLRVRRASTTGQEDMACVVQDPERGWCVVTDDGERLDVDEVTAAMVVAVQEDGALQ